MGLDAPALEAKTKPNPHALLDVKITQFLFDTRSGSDTLIDSIGQRLLEAFMHERKSFLKSCLSCLCAASFCFLPGYSIFAQTDSFDSIDSYLEQLSRPVSGFETYERGVDDLLSIALVTNPDPGFGIHSLIIQQNEKLKTNPGDTQALATLGHIYRILGQPGEANQFYEKALESAPEDFRLNIFSAKMHIQKEDLEKAEKRLREALKTNDEDVSVWTAYARIQMRQNREEEAIQIYERILDLDQSHEEAQFVLSLLYQKKGRAEKALAMMENLNKQRPQDALVWYHLGALLLAQGKSSEALKIWEELFIKGARAPQFLFNLTLAYLEEGEADKAQTILSHLRFFFPHEVDIDYLFAESYRLLGRLMEAEEKYRELLAVAPEYLSAYVGLAHVLEEKGETLQAQKVLERLRELRKLRPQNWNVEMEENKQIGFETHPLNRAQI